MDSCRAHTCQVKVLTFLLMNLTVRFGPLGCLNMRHLVVFCRPTKACEVYRFMAPSKRHFPNTFCIHAAQDHHTATSVLCCQDYAFTVVVLARLNPIMLDCYWQLKQNAFIERVLNCLTLKACILFVHITYALFFKFNTSNTFKCQHWDVHQCCITPSALLTA